jgi:hypothetical protein
MCCLFAIAAVIGPRFFMVVYWLADPNAWSRAYDNLLLPILGFVFLPWTTSTYVFVHPAGIDTADWLLLGLAVIVDVMSLGGGAFGNRDRMTQYRTY